MIYGQIYGEIYNVPGISVHFDACADSVYRALFSDLHGDEAIYYMYSRSSHIQTSFIRMIGLSEINELVM